MSELEDRALGIVADAIGATHTYRRDVEGGPPSMRDFDLEDASGIWHALEVTTIADEEQRSFQAAASKKYWHHDRLTNGWSVRFREPVHLGSAMPQVVELALQLEERGFQKLPQNKDLITCGKANEDLIAIDGAAREFRVGSLSVFSAVENGSIEVSPDTGGWITTSVDQAMQSLLDVVLDKGDNQKKLAASNHPRTHLFVWVDYRSWFDWGNFDDERSWGGTPVAAPKLPAAITDLWIGLDNRVWHWHERWTAIPLVPPG